MDIGRDFLLYTRLLWWSPDTSINRLAKLYHKIVNNTQLLSINFIIIHNKNSILQNIGGSESYMLLY